MQGKKVFVICFLVMAMLMFSTGMPQHGNVDVSAQTQADPDSENKIVRVYFSDRKIGNQIFIGFENFILETNYDEKYHIMEVNPDELVRLQRADLNIVEDPDYIRPQVPMDSFLTPFVTALSIPGYSCYSTVEETYLIASDMATANPDLVQWLDVGDSWEKTAGIGGYDLMVMKLTNTTITEEKPKLFITCSIHAREYTPAALCLEYAQQLVDNYNVDADSTWILDHHEIHLMLHANPDGRKKAEAGISWRKNTNQNYCSPTSNYRGVDLMRNFEFRWGCCGGSSGNECDLTYRGPSAASEPETQAIQAYLQSIFPDQRADGLDAPAPDDTSGLFFDMHSYSELVLWPWGSTAQSAPNSTQLQTLGRKFAHWNGYTPEQAMSLYPTDGTTTGFVYGELGIASYTFELGTAFFQSCDVYTNDIVPDNLPVLFYAAKVVRTPYLTPAGPNIYDVAVSADNVPSGLAVTLTAVADDTQFNNSNGTEPTQTIAAVEYYVDTPPWVTSPLPYALSMTAADGSFNAKVETATAAIDTTGWSDGKHIIFVRGQDFEGNWGAFSAIFLTIENQPCTEDSECNDGTYCNGIETCVNDICQPGSDPCPGENCDETTDTCVAGPIFEDDFENGNALGWDGYGAGSTANTGDWIIGDPVGTVSGSDQAQPENAYTGAGCAFTAQNTSLGSNDVDSGVVYLVSPTINLSGAESAELEFVRWFYNRDTGEDSGDFYTAQVSSDDGATWVDLERLDTYQSANSWTEQSFLLENFISLTATVKFRFGAADGSSSGNIIEAAIDNVKIWAYGGCEYDTDCDDGVDCTVDVCNTASQCENTPNNGFCDDGEFCTGVRTCDAGSGCTDGTGPCPGQYCDETTDTCYDCENDGNCDDGLFCNGAETCLDGVCQGGAAACPELCDESTDICVDCFTDNDCSDSVYCNGLEQCVIGICEPPGSGTPVDCDDGVDCTIDSCNESAGACENTPDDTECDNGLYCDGLETCDAGIGCRDGTDLCPGQLCDETGDENVICYDCVNDADCDDGLFCNGAETCIGGVCQTGTNPCPGENCDETTDTCVAGPIFEDDFENGNALGWDGYGAGSTANTGDWIIGDPVGTVSGSDQAQPENAYTGAGCAFTAQNTSLGSNDVDSGVVYLVSPTINLSGAESAELEFVRWFYNRDTGEDSGDFYTAQVSSDDGATWVDLDVLDTSQSANSWTAQSFMLENYVSLTATMKIRFGAADGSSAGNIIEAAIDDLKVWAYGGCENDVDCDDGVACTDDVCNTTTSQCENTPNNGNCDNGFYCDGVETCDAVLDCQPGTDPCPGPYCDETGDENVICYECVNDSECDNGQFCDGVETCEDGFCQEGTEACPGQLCDESTDICADCFTDTDCSDGNFCDGAEQCVAGVCQEGTPVDCDDGVTCTIDSCNESAGACENTPDDTVCDNGLYCDGLETCDAGIGCKDGTDLCPGQYCDETGTGICYDCINDADCDDDLFCNGTETCSGGVCDAGTDPCPGQTCDETADQCNSGPVTQMETGTIMVGGNEATITLSHSYVSPVVVCSVQYNNNTTPVVVRVKNVTPSSFDVYLQNPSDGAVAEDLVSYLVVEEGTWVIDGVKIEAQTYLSTVTDENNSWNGEAQTYGQSYTQPVVLGQVMSANDARWSVFWCSGTNRSTPPSGSALITGKTVCEDSDTTRTDETIGFVVVEAGQGTIGGVAFEAKLGSDTVRGIDNSPPFTYAFDSAFNTAPAVAVTTMAAMDGGNGGWAYAYNADTTTLDLVVDEDQISDSERRHTTEQVGYVVFESSIVYPPVP